MKYAKTYIGSLIISFGIFLVIGSILMASGTKLPEVAADYLLEAWLLMGLIMYPFAKKIVRV